MDELLAQSDVVSVHTALTPETKGMFGMEQFKKMKPTAIFINTARGGVHKEDELTEALRERIIWGAGLDVTNPEPMSKDNPLLEMENAVVFPHIGSATKETRDEMCCRECHSGSERRSFAVSRKSRSASREISLP